MQHVPGQPVVVAESWDAAYRVSVVLPFVVLQAIVQASVQAVVLAGVQVGELAVILVDKVASDVSQNE